MARKKKIIVANWKLNPTTVDQAKRIFVRVKRGATRLTRVHSIICPPFVFLGLFAKGVSGNRFALGAQDSFWELSGAYTGEISPSQLFANNVRYTILGHSERRTLGETDEMISKKVLTALKEGLSVILCVGEAERDSEGRHFQFIEQELRAALGKVPRRYFQNVIVAYEPIWAISSNGGGPATPEAVREMTIFIRKVLTNLTGRDLGLAVPVLYGGSVSKVDAQDFLLAGVDGLLVGKASLDPEHFVEILKIAEKIE